MREVVTTIGTNVLSRAGQLLDAGGAERICCVVDETAYRNSGAEALLEPVLAGRRVAMFTAFSPNPKLEDIVSCSAFLREHDADAVIAVGGGSALDVAKSARLLARHGNPPETIVAGKAPIVNRGIPMLAVPTTAGTGSEATHFAVIYVDGRKTSLAHEHILPEWAVVDSRLTENLPPRLTAMTGFDALSQALESMWAPAATPDSRADAQHAIRRIRRSLIEAVQAPTPRARLDMAEASNRAGRAINVTKTTAPHAVSYTITSSFGIPHGHAVALTVAPFIRATAAQADRLPDTAGRRRVGDALCTIFRLFEVRDAGECALAWKALMVEAGLEPDLASLGIAGAASRERIAAGVNTERLSNHPVPVTRELLDWVLDQASGT